MSGRIRCMGIIRFVVANWDQMVLFKFGCGANTEDRKEAKKGCFLMIRKYLISGIKANRVWCFFTAQ